MDQPPAHVYLDGKSPDGSVANWNLELASPNMLIRNGWRRDSLVANDHIKVTASRARDGTNTAAVVLITRDDGSELTFISGDDRQQMMKKPAIAICLLFVTTVASAAEDLPAYPMEVPTWPVSGWLVAAVLQTSERA